MKLTVPAATPVCDNDCQRATVTNHVAGFCAAAGSTLRSDAKNSRICNPGTDDHPEIDKTSDTYSLRPPQLGVGVAGGQDVKAIDHHSGTDEGLVIGKSCLQLGDLFTQSGPQCEAPRRCIPDDA